MPAWLLAEDGMKLRISYQPFMKHIEEYYHVLMKELVPLQADHGGPVILMQVENEYGYYATDREYLEWLRNLMQSEGVTVPLVTSDGPTSENLSGGSVRGALATGNFGSQAEARFRELKPFTNGGPLMCMEFWVGWFDHWGNDGHMAGNLEKSAKDLEQLLKLGHLNIYMFEGGTNFGFMNGANYYDQLTPDVTSYDYDAVLTEDGQITEKYRRYQEIIGRYQPLPEAALSIDIQRKEYGRIPVLEKVGLFSVLDDLSSPVHSAYPQSMEKLGQNYGYILYRSPLDTENHIERLRLWKANDRANVFVDGKPAATLYDLELQREKTLDISFQQGAILDILMENMGRVNFGPRLEEQRKGIDQCVEVNNHTQSDWQQYPLPLDNLDRLDFTKEYQSGIPGFYRFAFEITEAADTFLDFSGWGKGCALVNGFNIGRFWEIGPQRRLYVPGPLLKIGKNEIILFETEGKTTDYITLTDKPAIG